MADRGLTPKQARFVEEYLLDLNATQAAIRAGYSAKRADAIGFENLRKPGIAAAIEAAKSERSQRTQVTIDRVVQELARLAFFDARKLLADDGTPLPLSELDEDTARAIIGVDIARIGNGEVGVGEVLKFKLADKKGALELLGKHLAMFTERLALSDPNGQPLQPTQILIVAKETA